MSESGTFENLVAPRPPRPSPFVLGPSSLVSRKPRVDWANVRALTIAFVVAGLAIRGFVAVVEDAGRAVTNLRISGGL